MLATYKNEIIQKKKRAIQETAEATGDLIGDKIADKITSISKIHAKELHNNEITTHKKIRVSRRKTTNY